MIGTLISNTFNMIPIRVVSIVPTKRVHILHSNDSRITPKGNLANSTKVCKCPLKHRVAFGSHDEVRLTAVPDIQFQDVKLVYNLGLANRCTLIVRSFS